MCDVCVYMHMSMQVYVPVYTLIEVREGCQVSPHLSPSFLFLQGKVFH